MPKSIADACHSVVAVVADVATAAAAVFVAVWLRFDSGLFHDSWFAVRFGRPENVYLEHLPLALAVGLFTYATLRHLKLYRRPQRGTFLAKLPRLLRGAGWVTMEGLMVLAVFRNYTPISAGVVLTFLPCFALLLLVQRAILFRLEIRAARHAVAANGLLIIGTDATAAHLMRCFKRDPRLRVSVSGVLRVRPDETPDAAIPPEQILGGLDDFDRVVAEMPTLTQVIITDPDIPRKRLNHIAAACEKRLVRFNIVPDMFLMMTGSIEVETIDDIPLLGLKASPLDKLGNRITKRVEDVVGALAGLLVAAPLVTVMAVRIRRESPGPVFFRQTRCGYGGKPFTIYKLRSMRVDAEAETGAVFADVNDPRRTRVGAWMRAHNVDELPQFWNVLKGDMSLVGPRPERPEFVEQFSSDIAHYMRRHVCRPGITGWAQVHGLRGNTSIEDRLRHDLWYLENWSVALDVKILLRTCFARRNAY